MKEAIYFQKITFQQSKLIFPLLRPFRLRRIAFGFGPLFCSAASFFGDLFLFAEPNDKSLLLIKDNVVRVLCVCVGTLFTIHTCKVVTLILRRVLLHSVRSAINGNQRSHICS